MNNTINHIKPHLFIFLVTSLLLIISINIWASSSIDPVIQHESDSISALLQKCPNDTCKCNTLFPMFWKYLYKESKTAKYYGYWACNELKDLPFSTQLADLYSIKGNVYMEECLFDSAYVYFQKELELSKTLQYNLGWAYYHVATVCYYTLRFRKALENLQIAEQYLNKTNEGDGITWLYPWLYRELGLSDSANICLNKKLKESKGSSDKINEVAVYNNMANFYRFDDNLVKSLEYWNKALQLSDSIHNELAICNIYGSIGDVFMDNKMNYSIAREYFNIGLEKSIEAKDFFQEFRIRMKLGNLLLKEGNDTMALAYSLKCWDIAREKNDKRHFAHIYRLLGYCYENVKDYNQAYYYFKKCFESNCLCCNKLFHHDAYLELGDVCMKLNHPDEAIYYYQKSLEIAQCFHASKEIASSYLRLGNYYRALMQTKTAEKNYLSAYDVLQGTKHYALLKSIADTLNHFYFQSNELQKAYHYLEISRSMSDSLAKSDKEFSLADLEMRFDFEKLNKENEKKQIEIRQQKLIRNSLIVISVLLVIMGVISFTSYSRKKKDNKLLSERNKEIEEKNLEIQSQVEEITTQKDEIKRISDELHESDEMKLRFFSNLSHEFRTPLTLILNPAQDLLSSFSGNDDHKKQLEGIFRNAHKLLDLTNQILDLQKLDAGKLRLNLTTADIVEYYISIVASFDSMCTIKNNAIRFHSNHKSVLLPFDKDKIGKILVNLLSNALKFCHNNSTIEADIIFLKDQLIVSVSDKGIGIPAGQIDNVFKRYYQVPSDQQAQGTGIGLAYVKELVGFLKGHVTIESVLNEGTKVTISLPSGAYTIQDPQEFSVDIPKNRKSPVAEIIDYTVINDNPKEKAVLIVEDNDELRAFISGLLRPDYSIYMAKDGKEGLQIALQSIPDIIISDVMMPHMDGFELCRNLKQDVRTSHIPVILLTAKDTAQSTIEGYKTGADDFIVKPFDNEILKLKVGNIMTTHYAVRKQFDFKSIPALDHLKIGNTDKEFLKKCFAFIDNNIDEPDFSVDKLAAHLNFSSRSFYRKIEALTNQTPAELIRVYRLHIARKLLETSDKKVFEVASYVGYEDVKRFSQAFKKQYGFSPSEKTRNK